MKKYLLLLITVLLSIGIVYSQVQVKKPVQKQLKVLRTIKVLYPNGGEKWVAGGQYNIRWQSRGISGKVAIALLKSGREYLRPAVENTGSHLLKVRRGDTGTFKIRITSLDGSVKDESDRAFTIQQPEVDLTYDVYTSTRRLGRGHVKIIMKIKNNGTKILHDVLFNWVITKDNRFIVQDGAGFGTMYPDTWYKADHQYHLGMGKFLLRVYVDPDNRQREPESLRDDNTCTLRFELKK